MSRSTGLMRTLVHCALACAVAIPPAFAGEVFHASDLQLSTQNQSMWSSGSAFNINYSKEFLTPSISTGSLTVDPPAVGASGVTVDTKFAVSATGQMGVGAGVHVNGGQVSANLDYNVGLSAPDRLYRGTFFSLGSSASKLSTSSLTTQSPTAEAYLEGILNFSSNYYAEAKVSGGTIFNGVSNGTFKARANPLVSVNLRQDLYSFNHNGNGRLIWKGADVGGVGDTIAIGTPTAPQATFKIGDWRIDASGGLSGNKLVANGNTTLLTTTIDVDSSLTGGSPLTGASLNVNLGDNVHFNAGYDILDFKTQFDTGYQQHFELTDNLLVNLTFSNDVLMRDAAGNVTQGRATGLVPISELPDIALLGHDVQVTPEFTVQADLLNQTKLSLQTLLLLQALRGNINFDFNSTFYSKNNIVDRNFGPLYQKSLQFDPLLVSLYNQTFALQNFNTIVGDSFTLTAVPLPPAALLFASGLLGLVLARRRRRR